jgi:peroxiredoxin family protein
MSETVVALRVSPLEDRVARLEEQFRGLAGRTVSNRATIVVFSGDLDKVFAGLVIATGAAAMGLEVSMFHTFWGLNALLKRRKLRGKKLLEKAMSVMTPAGLGNLNPSKLSFAGAGAAIFRKMMKDKGVQSPEELFALARELGVKVLACEMSMEVMGIRREELIDGIAVAGVGAYLGDAADSKVTLFI